jgi:hypothetical protein
MTVWGQDFKKFRVVVGGGYAKGERDGINTGGIFYLEPSYRIHEQIIVGIRAECTIVNEKDLVNNIYFDDFSSVNSLGISGQYYFKSNMHKRKPFIGTAITRYGIPVSGGSGSLNGLDYSESLTIDRRLGFSPRIGFDFGHFTICLEYNTGPVAKKTFVFTENGKSQTIFAKANLNYFGFKAGIILGGGRK